LHGKDDRSLDARAALEGARRYGAELRRRGVKPGDRVPVLMPTSVSFVEALLGTMWIGAVPAPLASPMTFGSLDRYMANLTAVVEDSGARCIVTYGRVRDAIKSDDRLRELLEEVVTEEDLGATRSTDPRGVSIDGTDTALIQYTSGTTGRPKGVVISHRALVSNAAAIAQGLQITSDDVGISWLPMFHDMGLIGVLLTAVCHPYPIHILRPESFVMRPRCWLELISKVGGTLSAAPNFAYDLSVTRGGDLSEVRLNKWRVALNGAEPVHAATVERFENHHRDAGFGDDVMLPVYGLAESTLAVTFPTLDAKSETEQLDRARLEAEGVAVDSDAKDAQSAVSVGRPVPGMAVSVVNEGGDVLGERRVGEVRVQGPSLMNGYFRNETASAEALSDGWLRTGDLGFMDRGRLFIVGRQKEVIIKGGRNIYPYDVERVAKEIEGVRGSTAAFARPNESTGTDDLIVVAEVMTTDETKRERIKKEIRGELLATLGVKPDAIHIWGVGSVPRTTSGKIRRAECERILREGNGK
jgi:acyl-CoA synthetase (AMP-forming)/AMP-acid ligase II